jgi:beta-N-acetylhexosaminidase
MRSIHPALFFPLLATVVVCLGACSSDPGTDKPHGTPLSGQQNLVRAHALADSIAANLPTPQLLRQLCIVPAPAGSDSVAHAQAATRAEAGVAGFLAPLMPLVNFCIDPAALDSAALSPIWTVADLDADWFAYHDLPALVQVGAADENGLTEEFTATIGRSLRHSGLNTVLLSLGRVIDGGSSDQDALGGDPELVFRLSSRIQAGLDRLGIASVMRPIPALPAHAVTGVPISQQNASQAKDEAFLPYRALAGNGSVNAQLSFAQFPNIDTVIAPFSARLHDMLRDGPDGLLFSPTLDSTRLPSGLDIGNAAINCLLAGADLLVLRNGDARVMTALEAAVAAKTLDLGDLRKKAARIIFQKLSRAPAPPAPSLSIPVEQSFRALDRIVVAAAVTLLRDDQRLLPLRGPVAGKKICLLGWNQAPPAALAQTIGLYAPLQSRRYTPGDESYADRKALLKSYELLLVAIGPESRLDSLDLAHLQALDSAKKLVVLHLGPGSRLSRLAGLHCVVEGWDSRPQTQSALGQFLFGALGAAARLPMHCGDGICYKDGLPRQGGLRLAYTIPEEVGANLDRLARIDSIVAFAIRMGVFPGCQVLAAKGGKVFLHKAYGHQDYTESRPVRTDDLYDIASITKIAATTLMAMRAWERKTLQLDLPLRHYLQELDSSFITIKDITPSMLMLHQAGLPSGLPIYAYCMANDSAPAFRKKYYSASRDSSHTVQVTEELWFNPLYLDTMWLRVRRTGLDSIGKYRYSDMSMFLMQRVLERICGAPLDRFCDSAFYKPMGLRTLCYKPTKRFSIDRIAPTENDRWWRNQQVHGFVHDPTAAMYGGVGGHAGLFSDAWDLAAILQMLLNEGSYAGRQLLSPEAVRYFTSRQPGSHRGLGFDMQRSEPTPDEGMLAWSAAPSTFGHLGFTGTCAWADPENDIVFVFLSNRVYPKADNKKINALRIRQAIQQTVYEALQIK